MNQPFQRCTQCGAALSLDDMRAPNCRYCGAVLPHYARAAEQAALVREVMAPPAGQPGYGAQPGQPAPGYGPPVAAPGYGAQPGQPVPGYGQAMGGAPRRAPVGLIAGIAGGLVLLLVGGGIAVWLFFGKSSPPSGERDGPSAAGDATPPGYTWKDYKLTLEGSKANASFFMSAASKSSDEAPLRVKGYFNDFPGGTKVKLGAEAGTTSDTGHLALQLDVKDKIGKLEVDKLQKEVDVDVPLAIELPGKKPLDLKVPTLHVKRSLASGLAQVVDRPVAFAGEPASPGKPDAAAVVDHFGDMRVLGSASLVWDIDWVAVEETLEKDAPSKVCKGYEKVKEISLKLLDSQVKLYDRRTAKLLKEQRFKASDRCPSVAFVQEGSSKSYASKTDIDKWVRAQLGK
jgi:hypothetical protein